MGTPRLKKKIELNYRRGYAAHDCSECNAYISKYEVHAIGGDVLRIEPRCMLMGLKDGRAYKINPKNICDAHDNSHYIKRLRGW